MEQRISRRRSLGALAGLAAGALGWDARDAAATDDGPAAVASGLVKCVLSPELTEGPFSLPDERVRRNITEGRRGTPLALRSLLTVTKTAGGYTGAITMAIHRT